MNLHLGLLNATVCGGLLLGAAGCPSGDQGPFEEAGEKIDETVDDVVDGAKKVGEETKDTLDEVTDPD